MNCFLDSAFQSPLKKDTSHFKYYQAHDYSEFSDYKANTEKCTNNFVIENLNTTPYQKRICNANVS